MRIRRWILLAAFALASAARADDDWLPGEYEVHVPDDPSHFVLVIVRDAQGRLDGAVYKEAGDAASGRSLVRIEPWRADEPWHGGKLDEVREMSAEELAPSDLARAHLRCAEVGALGLCRIPDGASFEFDGRTLGPGHFGFAMHVGYIEVRKRTPGAMPAVPPPAPHASP